jgi:Excalibur calcium-binding domain
MGHPTRRRARNRVTLGCVISTVVALTLLAGCADGAALRTAPPPTPTSTPAATPTVTVTVTATLGTAAAAPSGLPSPDLTASRPAPAGPLGSGTDPNFTSCGEANAAGYGPYRRGVDPEYAWYTDRDGDGVVCER